jgi:hypothetical protein
MIQIETIIQRLTIIENTIHQVENQDVWPFNSSLTQDIYIFNIHTFN